MNEIHPIPKLNVPLLPANLVHSELHNGESLREMCVQPIPYPNSLQHQSNSYKKKFGSLELLNYCQGRKERSVAVTAPENLPASWLFSAIDGHPDSDRQSCRFTPEAPLLERLRSEHREKTENLVTAFTDVLRMLSCFPEEAQIPEATTIFLLRNTRVFLSSLSPRPPILLG